MSARLRLVFALAASVVLPACQAGDPDQAPAPAARQEGSAPAASSPAAASHPAFAPPTDSRLTAAHVQQYLAVRRRAIEMARQNAGSTPSLLQMLSEVAVSETRAAEALGHNVNEYRWIQARIAEASMPAIDPGSGAILKAIEAAAAKSGAQLQKAAEAERGILPRSAPDPAVIAYNRSVLEPFRAELAALEQESARLGA